LLANAPRSAYGSATSAERERQARASVHPEHPESQDRLPGSEELREPVPELSVLEV